MTVMCSHRRVVLAAIFASGCLAASPALTRADYEVPNPAYAAPANYYNAANPANLRMSLHNIISTGFVARSYGDARYAFAITDKDPNNANNIRLIYNGNSVNSAWDGGITYNREHLVCQSWMGVSVDNSYTGPASDLFELRPATPSVNSARGNDPYGNTTISGAYGQNGNYWYAGDNDAGQVARSLFYMATMYYTGSTTAGPNNLQIINTSSTPANGSWTAGDLNSLLHWNYKHGVDNFERYRNQAIYSNTVNPDYYQANRNPYIDHPEYVWSVFGGGNNNSQISVATPSADGSSAKVLAQRVIKGSAAAQSTSVTISKNGANPTTYDLTATANATLTSGGTSVLGTGQAFDYDTQSRNLIAAYTPNTASLGLKSGSINVHNSDLSSSGTGHGSADGDDTITFNTTVLDHSQRSFTAGTASTTLTLNFGSVTLNGGAVQLPISLYDLGTNPLYTAMLDLDSITGTGATSVLTTNLAPTTIAGGSSATFAATFTPGALGSFTAVYTLGTSDENITGGYSFGSQLMTLTLTGTVVPEPATFSLLGLAGMMLLARRSR